MVQAALALSHKRLTELKQEYAEDVALYWEAVAAIAEADIDVIVTRAGSGEMLVKLGDLKERLFAPGLPALLNANTPWWQRETSGAEDYRNIVSAIIGEVQALADEARSKAAVPSPEMPAISGAPSREEARAVLGVGAQAGLGEIGLTFAGLLQLWISDDAETAEALARQQEIMAVAVVLLGEPLPGRLRLSCGHERSRPCAGMRPAAMIPEGSRHRELLHARWSLSAWLMTRIPARLRSLLLQHAGSG